MNDMNSLNIATDKTEKRYNVWMNFNFKSTQLYKINNIIIPKKYKLISEALYQKSHNSNNSRLSVYLKKQHFWRVAKNKFY